jgi:hypothetical protein
VRPRTERTRTSDCILHLHTISAVVVSTWQSAPQIAACRDTAAPRSIREKLSVMSWTDNRFLDGAAVCFMYGSPWRSKQS